MPVSDALVVGEGWISEHYFTTDATKESFQAKVVERRKAWDAEKDAPTTRSRFSAVRAELLSVLATLAKDDDRLPGLYETVQRVLGYHRVGLKLDHHGPVVHVHAAGLTGAAPLAIVHARPCESVEDLLAKDAQTLLGTWEPDEGDAETSAARTVSRLFTAAEHPDFVLVLAGGLALVAERERWAEGRYLLVDLQLVCERNEDKKYGEVDRALTCLDAESLAPDADGNVWWRQPLEESVRHTVGVSSDLREGVRLSIEIIANEVVARRAQQGLDPLPAEEAQPLARQSLRFLYRILFLLYAEASPELGVLPVGAPEYERGYSLDRLRDLTLVQLATPAAEQGTHLHDSLDVLFRLVDQGHAPKAAAPDAGTEGLTFRSLKADLFLPEAVGLISEVRLGNAALQRVLQHLLLSKEKKGNDRGFISYAELGINQLGAVYEGLMSYTGFFATEDLHEVAKGGDASKGSWVVPTHRSDGIAASDFVMETDEHTGEKRPVVHERGSFVYRLAGRERQQSASYYTPEVLTKFVVSQALEELLDQDGTTSAREILDLTVCEPALGSGAFAIEAVRQLAAEYLTRRQAETGETIDPDDYPRELQKVKAYLALHQVHGVDLNATAVELAEISLWLDTMVEGLEAPWFGLHLRRGNSLIGARRSMYRTDHLKGRAWLKTVPIDKPLHDPEASTEGMIHHFLLPADGWGAAVDAKEGKELAPEAVARLKAWRKSVLKAPTRTQEKALLDIARRVEVLWSIAARRLEVAEQQIRRSIAVWGVDHLPVGGSVTREQIEQSLGDPDGAYRRLRSVMDAWCALWFWPLTETLVSVDGEPIEPPSLEEWIETLQTIVGVSSKPAGGGQMSLTDVTSWTELNTAEHNDRVFSQASAHGQVVADHPWLTVADKLAEQHGFFHWELDFSSVFGRGGFDLQVGNPPWVRPDWDEGAVLAEFDIRFALQNKVPVKEQVARRDEALLIGEQRSVYLELLGAQVALRSAVSHPVAFPHLAGLRPDLYRCFMERTWRNQSGRGVVALIHPETHFTDEKAGPLRQAAYGRLRRHWQFVNELQLFEIHHLVSYGVHVYGREGDPFFKMATSLYHPDTVARSLDHDGSGDEPGIRDSEGKWDLRPHADRVIVVDDDTLATWHAILESDNTPVRRSRMVYSVNRSTAVVLGKTSTLPRMRDCPLQFSLGFDEGADFKAGAFRREWGRRVSWQAVTLQGPHIFVNSPFYKQPNRTMKNNKDWALVDMESMSADAVPTTSYTPSAQGLSRFGRWSQRNEPVDQTQFFRIAWRAMAANTGERTLIPALVPPGATHVDGINSLGLPSEDNNLELLRVLGFLSSLALDFLVRAAPKSALRQKTIERLPLVRKSVIDESIQLRVALMNCLTDAYSDAWSDAVGVRGVALDWSPVVREELPSLRETQPIWAPDVAVRRPRARRGVQVELDALVALALGLSAEELCTIYRTQFSVLNSYDRSSYYYDVTGRLVPNSVLTIWQRKGDRISEEERTATHPASTTYTYELPFVTLDREADMRQAYSHFEERLRDES